MQTIGLPTLGIMAGWAILAASAAEHPYPVHALLELRGMSDPLKRGGGVPGFAGHASELLPGD